MSKRRKNQFKLPYLGIDKIRGYSILYNEKGDFGVILNIKNPVLQYSADPSAYDNFHHLYVNVIKVLGEGFLIQKQDILCKRHFSGYYGSVCATRFGVIVPSVPVQTLPGF